MRRRERDSRRTCALGCRLSVLVASCVLVPVAIAPMRACADGSAVTPPGPAPLAPLPPPPITTEQLDAFVELTREPKPWVWYRLLSEPGLVPYAVAAADARLERRAASRRLAAIGFAILGGGSIIGAGLWVMGLREGISCGGRSGCGVNRMSYYAIPLILISVGVGGGLGISGITSGSRTSQAEHEVLARYWKVPAPPTAPNPSPAALSDARAPAFGHPEPLSAALFDHVLTRISHHPNGCWADR
jgi:hypothetical protein